jgi:hypothetical protein
MASAKRVSRRQKFAGAVGLLRRATPALIEKAAECRVARSR